MPHELIRWRRDIRAAAVLVGAGFRQLREKSEKVTSVAAAAGIATLSGAGDLAYAAASTVRAAVRLGYIALGIWLGACGGKTKNTDAHGSGDADGGTSQTAASTAASGGGTDPGMICEPGWTRCGDQCVMLDSNAEHCGACNRECPTYGRCTNGVCGCAERDDLCSGVCTDLHDDPENCGGCGNVCPEEVCPPCLETCIPIDNWCIVGDCTHDCFEGELLCDSSCVNVCADTSHCGACNNPCGPTQVCFQGECSFF